MKKVLILADTHMPKKGKALPEPVISELEKGVDLIFHAGDWSDETLYQELKQWAPVCGVRGNIEIDEWAKQLPEKLILKIEDVKIAIVHGHLGKGKTTPDRAYKACIEDGIDLIVFGHSHIPYMEKKGEIILFNPGSPTEKRKQKQFSFGLLTIHNTIKQLEHHFFTV
jgi:putative phosphoesterase